MYFAQMNPFGGIIDFISSGATLLAFDCIKKKKKEKKKVFSIQDGVVELTHA